MENQVFFNNVPTHFNKWYVSNFFGGAGSFKYQNRKPMIYLWGDSPDSNNGSVTVDYDCKQTAERAISMYNGATIQGQVISAQKSLIRPPLKGN